MSDGPNLLQKLGSGVRPVGAERPARSLLGAAGQSFAELLGKAADGQITSGLPVTVAKGAGVNLSADQLVRIGSAADRAQAAGADRAVVLIDGAALKLDVATRTITGPADLSPGATHGDIDALVVAAAGPSGAAQLANEPAGGLLKALAPADRTATGNPGLSEDR
ncbi:MAG: hypothetical protein IT436_07415 [Phycisphaerales bacterium]|nr:hypothetical protein [Phycisphaerales bacterium]